MPRIFDRLFRRGGPSPGEPSDDAVIARTALERRDFPHAAFHLGWALARQPARRELQGLVSRLAAAVEEPLNLVPAESWLSAGNAALRAHLLARRGRLDEALELVQALYESGGSRRELAEWAVEWCREAAGAAGSSALLDLYRSAAAPYVGYIPEAAEASIDALRQLGSIADLDHRDGTVELKLTLSRPEAPSVHRALAMEFERAGRRLALDGSFAAVPSPDPRRPLGEPAFRLWTDDEIPRPAIEPPSPELAGRIAEIAETEYSLDVWWQRGRELARRLGPESAEELLGVMLHPPIPRGDGPSWQWMRRVQLAAAFTIAHLDGGRAGLESLVLGPMDWTVEAGLIALGTLAREKPEIRDEALELFRRRLASVPEEGHVCYLTALCIPILFLLDVGEDDRRPFAELWQSLLED